MIPELATLASSLETLSAAIDARGRSIDALRCETADLRRWVVGATLATGAILAAAFIIIAI